MDTHAQPELLSVYVDGALDARDRAQIDAHLQTCATCRATVEALRATIADLRALPEPDWSEQDSWRLHAAMRRARSPKRARFAGAIGGIAAALVTVLAITLGGSDGDGGVGSPAEGPSEAVAGGTTGNALLALVDYDQETAYARLLDFAAPAAYGSEVREDGSALGDEDEKPAQKRATSPVPTTADMSLATSLPDEARSCADSFGSDDLDELVYYEMASYEGTPAYLFIYTLRGGGYILHVRAREDCRALYTASA